MRICRSFGEACERAGLPVRDPEWMHGAPALDERRALIRSYQSGGMGTEQYLRAMADATGGRYSVEEARQIHDAWLVEEYPGVLALVEALNAAPAITTACLSNTNERHWLALAADDSTAYPSVARLAHRFASHLVRVSKPEPGIYRHAERELGAEASDILFFDDLSANVLAARSLGWRAEVVDPEDSPAEQMARYLERHGIAL